MKNIHNQNEKKFHYSLRKIGGKGVVSAVIAVGFFFLGAGAVEAADVAMQAIKEGLARTTMTWDEAFKRAKAEIAESRALTQQLMDSGFIKEPPAAFFTQALDYAVEQIKQQRSK